MHVRYGIPSSAPQLALLEIGSECSRVSLDYILFYLSADYIILLLFTLQRKQGRNICQGTTAPKKYDIKHLQGLW